MTDAYISATRPQHVAEEVESGRRRGCSSFTLRSIDHGGMLDRERLGAARYAAGVQAGVRLEADEPAAAAPSARRR
jgi:L-alanine-DL-glutamate epimerase-like enolase superfamily enzyme